MESITYKGRSPKRKWYFATRSVYFDIQGQEIMKENLSLRKNDDDMDDKISHCT